MEHGALRDVTVLDLTRVLSGPFAAMWLGDLGANVIKVEMPGKGDDARHTPPFSDENFSTFFACINRNKRSVTLNLKDPEGRAIFLELVRKADVVLSNFRPGVMERLGLGYEELKAVNEGIIFAVISGFGQKGVYAGRPAYDIVAQGMGGIMASTGPEGSTPTRVGASIADITAGMNTVVGILAALHARTLTGKGQCVDIAMVDSVMALLMSENNRYFQFGHQVPPLGNRYVGNSPYGAFMAKDRPFILACGSDKLFAQFCDRVLHRPELAEDPRYCRMALRSDHHDEVKKIVEDWASQYTAAEAVQIILDAGVPAGPIFTMDDISRDPHIVEERKMLRPVEQPGVGKMTVTFSPIKLSDDEPQLTRPAPLLGQHNAEVYGELLGFDEKRIEELKEKGVL